MIILRNLSLFFGTQPVFDAISFTLQGNERIGLFGLNGAGKSTLLKAIAGLQSLDEGTISKSKGYTVAYLPQEVVLFSELSVIEETMAVFTTLANTQAHINTLTEHIAKDPDNTDLNNEYAQVCEQLVMLEPEKKQAEAERVLMGLGFSQQQLLQPVQTLSVGWKMRIVLAKLLLQKADFYLFDEPTNHLDIIAKEWFLRFLEKSDFGFMIVCHEKRFLNKLCTRILELERGHATLYVGDYDHYCVQKKEGLERLIAMQKQQQREIDQLEENIARFKAKASKAAMAQSMVKKLEKIERIMLPPEAKNITFRFSSPERSGKIVLNVQKLSYAFGEKQIFNNVSFAVERGNKVALVAANGVGKTTLLNVISKKLPLQTGTIEIGTNVKIAVFDQDQTASLNLEKTVLENARDAAGSKTEQTVRMLLGSFLFTGDFVHKKAKVLSGGERNRLGMVRIFLSDANVLFLDEPTNHLDIPSKELLLRALQTYEGTIVFVSHDHDFVNELASHIIELSVQGTTVFQGNYDEYLYHKQFVMPNHNDESVLSSQKNGSVVQNHNENASLQNSREQEKKLKKIEHMIEKTEQTIATVAESFADLSYGSDEFKEAEKKLNFLKIELNRLKDEWEAVVL